VIDNEHPLLNIKATMGLEIMQTCNTYHTDTNGNDICESYIYSGRLGDVSIPMLEAMGLITLWIVVVASVAIIFKKLS